MLAGLAVPDAGLAEILILGGSGRTVATRYPTGSILEEGEVVLATGEALSVVADGRMKLLKGPVRLAARKGKPARRGMLDRLASAARTVDERRVALGAVRGSSRQGGGIDQDPWAIDIAVSDRFCVQAPERLSLWRADSAAPVRASLEELETGSRVFFDWPKGSRIIAWPPQLRPSRAARYLFHSGAGVSRQFDIVLIDGKLDGTDLLSALAENRCFYQFDLLINGRLM
ncbi:hypothetical protein [Sphingobium sp.]|uniref:hypothetical protein n=1 Tax=Sphingobium sp. TaxID=1912891 RepID=UPI0028BEDC2E|nr:hypothetical protein [Sphingobium sp.]